MDQEELKNGDGLPGGTAQARIRPWKVLEEVFSSLREKPRMVAIEAPGGPWLRTVTCHIRAPCGDSGH